MLDTSGSMFGEKINHAVDALKNIITALPEAGHLYSSDKEALSSAGMSVDSGLVTFVPPANAMGDFSFGYPV